MSFAVDSIILPFLVVPPQSLPILPSFRRKNVPNQSGCKERLSSFSLSLSCDKNCCCCRRPGDIFSLSLSGLGDSVAWHICRERERELRGRGQNNVTARLIKRIWRWRNIRTVGRSNNSVLKGWFVQRWLFLFWISVFLFSRKLFYTSVCLWIQKLLSSWTCLFFFPSLTPHITPNKRTRVTRTNERQLIKGERREREKERERDGFSCAVIAADRRKS